MRPRKTELLHTIILLKQEIKLYVVDLGKDVKIDESSSETWLLKGQN